MTDLLCEKTDHVLTLTFNRPDRLNAISGQMLDEFSRRAREADRDRDVRVIVLTGAGRGFCSGLDLKAVASGTSDLLDSGTVGISMNESPPVVLHQLDTPTICALNGPAAGYGMDLALGCDLRIASERARFACPVKRGLVPESGGTWILPRLVGWARACEIALLARPLEPAQMLELGLVNRVVPHEKLMDEVYDLAHELAANAPLAVQATKRMMRLGLEESFEANVHHVLAELGQLVRTHDFREGLSSFVEKRNPKYEGR